MKQNSAGEIVSMNWAVELWFVEIDQSQTITMKRLKIDGQRAMIHVQRELLPFLFVRCFIEIRTGPSEDAILTIFFRHNIETRMKNDNDHTT